MLLHEIKPFADAHRTAIDTIIDEMEATTPSDAAVLEIPREKLDEWIAALLITKRGFNRFEACAIDEWKMKERLETRVRTCRLEHRDK